MCCKTTVQTRRQKKIETDERPKQKCFHAAAPCQARGQRLQEKTVSFSSALSRIICLSRACLGKLMAFSYINDFIHKWLYIKRPFSFTASLSGSSGRNSRNVPFASPSHSVGWRLLPGLSGLHAHMYVLHKWINRRYIIEWINRCARTQRWISVGGIIQWINRW
eukprot:COSAG06_NODE_4676_length_4043_cov_6.020039_4_plen_164_part_00